MVYIGALSVIIAGFMIWREYVVYLDRELYWCRELLFAIKDLREKMKCYLKSPCEWAREYENEALSRCGFLDKLRQGEDIFVAYKSSRDVCLSDKAKDILEGCFEHLGEGYIDTELESIELAIAKLSEEEKYASAEIGRKQRVAGAFLGAFASGIVILVI